jgi:hypothetical protein
MARSGPLARGQPRVCLARARRSLVGLLCRVAGAARRRQTTSSARCRRPRPERSLGKATLTRDSSRRGGSYRPASTGWPGWPGATRLAPCQLVAFALVRCQIAIRRRAAAIFSGENGSPRFIAATARPSASASTSPALKSSATSLSLNGDLTAKRRIQGRATDARHQAARTSVRQPPWTAVHPHPPRPSVSPRGACQAG